ncbi:MAG: hypothetical protein MMC23_005996 [Stictis urceolatum]|nr:hypothetical protein [Stictis urceolata]
MFGVLNSSEADTDPNGDFARLIINTSIAIFVLTVVAVGLRFLARRIVRQPFLMDDWLILAALPFGLLLPILNIIATQKGNFGRHFLTSTPEEIDYFFKVLMPYMICWTLSVAIAKLSVLFFYRRIFSTSKTKIPAYVLGALIILWEVAAIPMIVFSCVPADKFWNRLRPGHCQDLTNQVLGTAVPNVVLDLALLIFPIPLILGLQLPRPQKIAIGCIFMVGGFVILVASLRMVTIVQVKLSADATWAFIPLGIFSCVESNVGIICACLPSLTPLFKAVIRHTKSFSYGTTLAPTSTFRSRLSGKKAISSDERIILSEIASPPNHSPEMRDVERNSPLKGNPLSPITNLNKSLPDLPPPNYDPGR